MSEFKTLKKYLIGFAIFLFVWIPLINFINSNVDNLESGVPTENSINQQTKAESKYEQCQKVRTEGERLDKASADLVAEAKRLQRIWIVREMSNLKDEGKITPSEWGNFSTFMSKELGESNVPILEVMELMDKVVSKGYIKPYLPPNVVEVGTRAALSKSSSNYYVNYPECFSEIDYEMYRLMAELPESNGAWARKLESSFELIP